MSERVFRLSELPAPPQANNMYITRAFKDKRTGQIRNYRHPSKELDEFKERMERYKKDNIMVAVKGSVTVNEWLQESQDTIIRADTYFMYPRSKIRCLDGRMKRFDVSNRIKGLHDGLAEMLQIDDTVIRQGWFGLHPTVREEPWCVAVLRPAKEISVTELKLEEL